MSGATVSIAAGFLSGDVLNATNLDGGTIAASYNSATGVLTLSGTDSVAAYQAALDSVTFGSTSPNPMQLRTMASACSADEQNVISANVE